MQTNEFLSSHRKSLLFGFGLSIVILILSSFAALIVLALLAPAAFLGLWMASFIIAIPIIGNVVFAIINALPFLVCNTIALSIARKKKASFAKGIKAGFLLSLIPIFSALYAGETIRSSHQRMNQAYDGIEQNDLSICEAIKSVGEFGDINRGTCFSGIARNRIMLLGLPGDPTICERITGGTTEWSKDSVLSKRDYCFYMIATNLQDRSLCEKITTEFYLEECRRKADKAVPSDQKDVSISECTSEPVESDVGITLYPKMYKHDHLGYLGELLTASYCDADRIKNIFGVQGSNYTLKPDISTTDDASAELQQLLEEIGFECQQTHNETGKCWHWTLWKIVPVSEILKLEPYAEEIKSAGCINCG